MKVAVVVPGGLVPDDEGPYGATPALVALLGRLARQHEVHAFALRQPRVPRRYSCSGVIVHGPGRGPGGWALLPALALEHRRGAFDIVHGLWGLPAGRVAAAAARLLRRPLLIHLVGGEVARLTDIGYGDACSRRGRALLRRVLQQAAAVTATSEPLASQARRFGCAVERLALGPDRALWPPTEPRPRSPGEPARLVHVASLNRVKDQTTLLEACRRMVAGGTPFRLDVAGEDNLDGEIQRLAQTLGLKGLVQFHGHLPPEGVRRLFVRSHLQVLASRHEGGPVVAVEGALSGVPTVGTDVGFLAEWAPEAAVTVPVGDPEALATAVREILEDEERRLQLARRARMRAETQDADVAAARLAALYHRVASGSPVDRKEDSEAADHR